MDDTNMVAADQKFHLFPELPLHIRLRIWSFACLVPRMVGLWAKLISDDELNTIFFQALNECTDAAPTVTHIGYRFVSRSDTLSILQTCQEARSEGLQHYTLAFGYEVKLKIGNSNVVFSTPHRIYMNWEVDTICLMPCEEIQDFDAHALGHLPLGEVLSYFDCADSPKTMKIALGPCQKDELADFEDELEEYGLSPFTARITDITSQIISEFDLNDPPMAEYREHLSDIYGVPFAVYFVPVERDLDADMRSYVGTQLSWIRETYALSLSYRPEEKEQVMDQAMDELVNGTSPATTP